MNISCQFSSHHKKIFKDRSLFWYFIWKRSYKQWSSKFFRERWERV